MRGTLLNTATVAGGALLGLTIGKAIPATYQEVALHGLGLVTFGIGVKLFLQSKNIVAIAGAVAIGGLIGLALGFQAGLDGFAEWMRLHLGGEKGTFNEALITTSVLYCVGPMTLLGCLQDGLEGKIELLAIKSTMDGISAIFFAAALGPGVLATAAVVLVFQGALTLSAKPLKGFAKDMELVDEAGAAGGILMMAIALGLLELKKLGVASYLPALVLAPLFVMLARKWEVRRRPSPEVG